MSQARTNSHTVDLTQGPVHSHLIRMAIPMVIGIFATMAFNLADTYFIGQLGTPQLNAIGFASNTIVGIVIAASVGLSAGTSSVLSQAAGNKDMDEIRRLATNSFVMGMIASIILTIAGLLTIDPLFRVLGADEETMPYIHEYMVIWYCSIAFVIIPMASMGAMRAMGNTRLQSYIMSIAAVVNIILDPIMIFGWFGFPALGMEGAAWATFIARLGTFVAVIYYLIWHFQILSFDRETLNHFRSAAKKILHVGVPATGTNMIIPIAGSLVTAIVARYYGDIAVGATNVAMKIEVLAIIVFYALSSVVGPFAGQNLGARNYDRLDQLLKISALFCLSWGLIMAVVMAVIARPLASMFSDSPEIADIATIYLYVVPISFGAYGMVMTVNAIFNGLRKPLPGVMVSSLRVAIFQLPLVMAAAIFYDLPYVFAAGSISNILAGIIGYFWMKRTLARLRS